MIGYLTSGGVAEAEASTILVKSIGLNFYCIIAVLSALLISIFQFNIGPMKKAEERAETTGLLDDEKHGTKEIITKDKISDKKPRAVNLFVPMISLIVTILITLFVTGGGNLLDGSGMQALLWGCFVSLVVIGVMCVAQRTFTLNQVIDNGFKGASTMLSIAFILVFAFTMGTVVKDLDTGTYLAHVFESLLTPALLPALVFFISCLISLATGTSMGTMAIMAVIALPMAFELNVNIPLIAGAFFGGSIFGDHCSPISDTTIMSCSTTGCDIIDHVKTQAPYIAIYAVITFVLYVILGFVL